MFLSYSQCGLKVICVVILESFACSFFANLVCQFLLLFSPLFFFSYGLELCCFGYSHKLPLLLEKAAATVAKPALDPATFVRLKDKLHK